MVFQKFSDIPLSVSLSSVWLLNKQQINLRFIFNPNKRHMRRDFLVSPSYDMEINFDNYFWYLFV
jgi:hypothetical protein